MSITCIQSFPVQPQVNDLGLQKKEEGPEALFPLNVASAAALLKGQILEAHDELVVPPIPVAIQIFREMLERGVAPVPVDDDEDEKLIKIVEGGKVLQEAQEQLQRLADLNPSAVQKREILQVLRDVGPRICSLKGEPGGSRFGFYKELNAKFDKVFVGFNKSLKKEQKKARKAKSKKSIKAKKVSVNGIVVANSQQYRYQILSIQEVAKAKFSHASIASKTRDGVMTLEDLETAIKENGWKKKEPLDLYQMPDNSFVSWGNRRLYVLKRILEENVDLDLKVEAKIIPHYSPVGKKNLKHFLRMVEHAPEAEAKKKIHASEQVTKVRNTLLKRFHEKKWTALDLVLARIYVDAGKILKGNAVSPGNLLDPEGQLVDLTSSEMVMYGYDEVSVRESQGQNQDQNQDQNRD